MLPLIMAFALLLELALPVVLLLILWRIWPKADDNDNPSDRT